MAKFFKELFSTEDLANNQKVMQESAEAWKAETARKLAEYEAEFAAVKAQMTSW